MNANTMDAAATTNAEVKTDVVETDVAETDVVETDVVETAETTETEVEIGPVQNARIRTSHSVRNATAVKHLDQEEGTDVEEIVVAEETSVVETVVAEETSVVEAAEMMETRVAIGPVQNARILISHFAENVTAVKHLNQVVAVETVVVETVAEAVETVVVETVAEAEETVVMAEETVVMAEDIGKALVPVVQQEEMGARTEAAAAGYSKKENKARTQDIIRVKRILETHSMKTESRGDGHGR